jgi:glutamine amidotransferase-like uncharacterized protein
MNRLAIFLHHPECSIECASGIYTALSWHYRITFFKKEDLKTLDLNNFDGVVFPGGIGDSDSFHNIFTRRVSNKFADFIDRGGKYLGICMGAYWAGHWYFDLLDNIEVVQYIKRTDADIKRSFGTVTDVNWLGSTEKMYFYDGCTFVGDGEKETIATYANGDPMAIMQGNIGLIGCHPESEQSWYDKPFLRSHWHNRKHHDLLMDFVDKLMYR